FYFCETCGKRLTDKEIEQGFGRDKKLKGIFCATCAVGVMTVEFTALRNVPAPASKNMESVLEPVVPRRKSSATHPAVASVTRAELGPADRAGSRRTNRGNAGLAIGAGVIGV